MAERAGRKGVPSPAEVRDGLLRQDEEAAEIARSWVAGMVYGARWQLADPEGAVQEVVVRLLHLARTGRIRSDTNFQSFVRTVARHTCTDLFRRERLRGAVEVRDPEMEHRPGVSDDPEQALERKERQELLRYVFQALPSECRRLWQWVYGQGLPAAEVARRLGIRPGNARVRVHRCLEKARTIRREYALEGGHEGEIA